MKKLFATLCILLTFFVTSCAKKQNPGETARESTQEASKTQDKKKTRKVTRPDQHKAAIEAGDASVSDIKIAMASVAMYDHMYTIFDIMYDNIDDCDLALKKVKAYADAHRDEMLKAQEKMEEDNKSLSEKDKKRYSDWRSKRDMQMVNDTMKLLIEYNYRCKEQMIKINAEIASLSSK